MGLQPEKARYPNMIKEFGFTVIDADVVAREVMEPGREAYMKVVEHFGKEILLDNEQIDRQKLGAIVFHNEEKRQLLNSLVHPAVRKEMLKQKEDAERRGEKAVFLDILYYMKDG